MEFLVFDFALDGSPASLAVGLVILLALLAGIPYLGALSDRRRTQVRRQEPLRKVA